MHGADLRIDFLNEPSFQGENHAERLITFESDWLVLPSEPPVHCKCERHPIGFDNAAQSLNGILWLVQRPGNHQIITRLRAEQCIHCKSKYAGAEVTARKERAVTRARLKRHRSNIRLP